MDRSLFRITPSGACGLILAALAFAVLPAFAGSYWLSVFTSAGCFTMAAAGVSFMYARLGMVSLTQVGLMGIGGWVALRLNYAFAFPFEVNLLLAALATMVFGWLLALPALRMRGLYLALVTLMAAGGLEIVFSTFQFPNGGIGFWGVKIGSTDPFRGPMLAQTPADFLRYVIVMTTLGFLFIEAHRRTAPGRAWALIRRSEAAAMAAGVNVTLYKTWAFGIAGLLAGASGALLAASLGLLDDGTFRSSESIMIFALAVVGGARFWLGPVIAAVLYRVLPALLSSWGVNANLAYVIFGVGLLHALITAPNGIAGQIFDAARAVSAKLRGQK
jgi:branched-chain amino acid transport system permease protein